MLLAADTIKCITSKPPLWPVYIVILMLAASVDGFANEEFQSQYLSMTLR